MPIHEQYVADCFPVPDLGIRGVNAWSLHDERDLAYKPGGYGRVAVR
jgi:hypothetical protein